MIESWAESDPTWDETFPQWIDSFAYRICPEPKRETVTLTGADFGKGASVAWSFLQSGHIGAETHRITFDMIDGEPDPASIRMEKL